jgi:hypothetical protein
VDLYVTITLIGFAAVFAVGLALGFRTADKRAEKRVLEVLSRLDVLGLALRPRAVAAPAHRGLQRLPVVVLPSVARRVVDVTRDPETPIPPPSAERGAIVDVDLSVGPADDTTRGRWLRQVLGQSSPTPQEHHGIQKLRLVRPADITREDDTPAPEAQRAPILPPPSSSSPLRPSRR